MDFALIRERCRLWTCAFLTRRIRRLDTSKTGRTAARECCRQLFLRTRGVLLSYCPDSPERKWSAIRRFLLFVDPVSAGLWPHPRMSRGLILMQSLGRRLVILANPTRDNAARLLEPQEGFRIRHELE